MRNGNQTRSKLAEFSSIQNEARVIEFSGTKFKRISTSREPRESLFWVAMYFNVVFSF